MQKYFSEFASDVPTVSAAQPIYVPLREQGSLVWKPDIKPTFKPSSPREVDLQSYRDVAGVFCYTKIRDEHRILTPAFLSSSFQQCLNNM